MSAQENYLMKFENWEYINNQNFVKYFEYLDDTTSKLLPNASIRFTPLIASGQNGWAETGVCQEAFVAINQLIRQRGHIDFDSFEPLNTDLMEWDKTHMKDMDGIRFWKKIFAKL